jgi:hypothetical protein
MLNRDLIRKNINMVTPPGKFTGLVVDRIAEEAERYAREKDKGPDPRIPAIQEILVNTLAIVRSTK